MSCLQVIVNERSVKAIALVNAGATPFDFVWDVGTNPRLHMQPASGSVPKGERLVCELSYHPHVPDRCALPCLPGAACSPAVTPSRHSESDKFAHDGAHKALIHESTQP